MHCGHLQFQQGSWHHRNYILLNGKRHRLSIPIQRPHIKPIRDAWFSDQRWKEKHLKTIALAYGNAPYFDYYYPTLKEIIYSHPHSLERLNIELTLQLAVWLGINSKTIIDSASWNWDGDAVAMIIHMCRAVGANWYLSNEGARAYLSPTEEKRMEDAGIWHDWLNWKDPDEEPLSAIHHLFNLGFEAEGLIQ